MTRSRVSVHWFRRDLRLEDNTSLNAALASGRPVLCVFIFDTDILDPLPEDDSRVTFIYETLHKLHTMLRAKGSALAVYHGNPVGMWGKIIKDYDVAAVYTNRDYEPYALERDKEVASLLAEAGVAFETFKDHVIYEPGEILKADKSPYTVYTPYKKKWLVRAEEEGLPEVKDLVQGQFLQVELPFPALGSIGFRSGPYVVPQASFEHVSDYEQLRNDPAGDFTTHLGPHLRFGTVSIRKMSELGNRKSITFLSELIWREFFIQVLYHFPHVEKGNFNRKYDGIEWRNNEEEFDKWCRGKTGYPMVDAGMRQLNATGYMHNRVRMVVASFLTKHLLVDWRWGEAYFAEKLLDFELASNNGNWQWAAGTGCDAAPYFRIFNPHTQLDKFDPKHQYVRRWLPDLDSFEYPDPIVEHRSARERALKTYQEGINK